MSSSTSPQGYKPEPEPDLPPPNYVATGNNTVHLQGPAENENPAGVSV